ncbi:unnamed protein product [Rangifer tarandus platyrhynchus]|uniref:Uncharacterized protein n=1 Tax=Rangifer tarandus platyrhynchus TaxID=3082113 RepID=A0ABN8ZIQ2_RANTA|nr:unnamed protein product [Rangifer tarandus platyrhynchus]
MLGELMDQLGSEPEGLRRYGLCNKRQVAQTTSGSQDDSPNVERPAFPSRDIRNRPVPATLLQVPEKSDSPNVERPAFPSRDIRNRPVPATLLQVPEKSRRKPEVSVSYSSEDTYTFFCPRVISCGRQQQFWYGI